MYILHFIKLKDLNLDENQFISLEGLDCFKELVTLSLKKNKIRKIHEISKLSLLEELNISEKLKSGITEAECLKLLSTNGKLIKRPFLLSEQIGLVGFKEADWK